MVEARVSLCRLITGYCLLLTELSLPLFILGVLTVAGAVAAMTLRNLIHCVLSLAVSFVGVAMLFLRLGAEFVGFAQILVYVGAVAILIVFAILLTRSGGIEPKPFLNSQWYVGLGIGAALFGCLAVAIINARDLPAVALTDKAAPVKQIGIELMTRYVLPLEVIGLLLTAAMLGAVLIAWQEGGRK
jgi:NADH-quinone oxidoreductase subunit J